MFSLWDNIIACGNRFLSIFGWFLEWWSIRGRRKYSVLGTTATIGSQLRSIHRSCGDGYYHDSNWVGGSWIIWRKTKVTSRSIAPCQQGSWQWKANSQIFDSRLPEIQKYSAKIPPPGPIEWLIRILSRIFSDLPAPPTCLHSSCNLTHSEPIIVSFCPMAFYT